MSKIDLLDQQWIDLVFEGKNEAYGAYQIRRETKNRNLVALLTMICMIVGIVAFFLLYGVAKNAIEAAAEHETETVVEAAQEEMEEEAEEEEELVYDVQPEEEQVAQETLMNSEKFTDYEMDDEAPQEVTKTQDETAQSEVAIGAINFDEGSNEGTEVIKVNQKVVEEVQEVKEESVVFEVVEQMPSFPGGEKALMEFLSKNTKYPSVAEENGIQGRVVCTFVVETNGSITDVKVVRAVDPALDREAVRVIKSMPKWIPGKQNGKAVRVKYTVPVNFKLQ